MNGIGIKSAKDITSIERALPLNKTLEHHCTYDAIRSSAMRNPDKTAISFFLDGDSFRQDHRISYRTLLEKITQTANFFHFLPLEYDDVVAFILPNIPEAHYVIWGAQASCQVLAINPLLEPSQIRDLINSVGAKAVVTMNPMTNIDLWDKLQAVLPDLEATEHVIGVDIAQYVGGAKGLAAQAIQWRKRFGITMPPGKRYHNYSKAIRHENKHRLDFQRSYDTDTISSLFCTGGTTGLPKIARRTHRNELANVVSVVTANQGLLNKDKVILGGLPLFHVNGALVTGLLPFSLGATVVMATPQGYRGNNVLAKFWDIAEHFRVNVFSAVPTVYSALMNYPTNGRDLSSLEMGICGAAPMPVETFKSFQEKTGIKILEGYGLTEGTCVSSLNPFFGEQKIGSIGLRIPYQEMMCVEVVDDKIVRQCDVDEIGVLVVRGPNVFQGYQMEHQNQGLWLYDGQGNRWLNTGDLARQDADGYFWLTGRKKELIVRGGHNIEPKLIEETLCRHPAVNLAAAIGRPDAHAGEVPVCYVQTNRGHTVTSTELLRFAAENIPERAAVPKAIHIVTELPVTAVGKVFKPELEMQEIEKCIQDLALSEIPEQQIEVNVKQDPKHGILADVILIDADDGTRSSFARKLGQFTFKSSCL
ncbi:MAG: acyl-CoA synthetase [Pseudomonadota bacterium]|nr:acyl-CoA synthetase [Pseudomonadota bacterium]